MMALKVASKTYKNIVYWNLAKVSARCHGGWEGGSKLAKIASADIWMTPNWVKNQIAYDVYIGNNR